MLDRDNPILTASEYIFGKEPFKIIKGCLSSYIAYPLAEKSENRKVSQKISEIKKHYHLSLEQRENYIQKKLHEMLSFSYYEVPYYTDLFKSINFDVDLVLKDTKYLNDVPFLTKDIIREQGNRLISKPLSEIRHHVCKTGGSTGLSCFIYYDQEAADYSSAVTRVARDSIGNKNFKSELHFACQFPGEAQPKWPNREDFKCFAMNRSNIFFDSLNCAGLEKIWQTLLVRRPHLIHAHPSTIYALACYIELKYGQAKAFDIFESSGELLEPYMREKIEKTLQCKVVNRYGLAELGVMAYEYENRKDLYVFDSEGFAENRIHENGSNELVFTGFRNKLMPLIRYATGDLASVKHGSDGTYLSDVVGRIHDIVIIGGVEYPTHHIQDILDHRVGGIQEFQIDLRFDKPLLRVVLEIEANEGQVLEKITNYWLDQLDVKFVQHDDLIRVGHRAKFRHVVTK